MDEKSTGQGRAFPVTIAGFLFGPIGQRLALALIRAAIGAFVGCLIALMAGEFIFTLLWHGEPLGPGDGYGVLFASLIVGASLGAAFGVIFAAREVRGRAGATVQSVLYGVILGMVSGTLVGVVNGMGKPFAKNGPLIGGTLGAVLGGILGWETPRNSKVGRPSLPLDGVHDRELDG